MNYEILKKFHHRQVFIKKFSRVRSQSPQFFKVFGGLAFGFEVLNFLNVPLELWLFQVILKAMQARRIKKIEREELPAYRKCNPLWLPD